MPRVGKPFNLQDFLKRYRRGEGLETLAQEYRVGQSRLREAVVAAGIPLRGRREAMAGRWARATVEERRQLVAAAHEAARGRRQAPEEVQRRVLLRALELHRSGQMIGRFEQELASLLEARGLVPIPQQPVESYNIDLGIFPVAVEIHVAANHPYMAPKLRKRIEKLRGLGWSVCYVWITAKSGLAEDAADEIVAWHNVLKENPPAFGKYRVIRGSGELALPRGARHQRP